MRVAVTALTFTGKPSRDSTEQISALQAHVRPITRPVLILNEMARPEGLELPTTWFEGGLVNATDF
jgi:hypothetical protein